MFSNWLEIIEANPAVIPDFSGKSAWEIALCVLYAQERKGKHALHDVPFKTIPTPATIQQMSLADFISTCQTGEYGTITKQFEKEEMFLTLVWKFAQFWWQCFEHELNPDFTTMPTYASEDSYESTHCDDDFNSYTDMRRELKQIKGLNQITTERLLLLAGHLAVVPLDRSLQRILFRHGWLELDSSKSDIEQMLISGVQQGSGLLDRFYLWNLAIGQKFCGSTPHCKQCPLATLLPATGPIEMGESD